MWLWQYVSIPTVRGMRDKPLDHLHSGKSDQRQQRKPEGHVVLPLGYKHCRCGKKGSRFRYTQNCEARVVDALDPDVSVAVQAPFSRKFEGVSPEPEPTQGPSGSQRERESPAPSSPTITTVDALIGAELPTAGAGTVAFSTR